MKYRGSEGIARECPAMAFIVTLCLFLARSISAAGRRSWAAFPPSSVFHALLDRTIHLPIETNKSLESDGNHANGQEC